MQAGGRRFDPVILHHPSRAELDWLSEHARGLNANLKVWSWKFKAEILRFAVLLLSSLTIRRVEIISIAGGNCRGIGIRAASDDLDCVKTDIDQNDQ